MTRSYIGPSYIGPVIQLVGIAGYVKSIDETDLYHVLGGLALSSVLYITGKSLEHRTLERDIIEKVRRPTETESTSE